MLLDNGLLNLSTGSLNEDVPLRTPQAVKEMALRNVGFGMASALTIPPKLSPRIERRGFPTTVGGGCRRKMPQDGLLREAAFWQDDNHSDRKRAGPYREDAG
jgi:hypothetical protein